MSYKIMDRYINEVIDNSTPDKPYWNIEHLSHGRKPHWNYIDGCMISCVVTLYEQTKEKKLLDFVENFIDYYIFEDGSIRGYELETYNIDNISEGRVLFDLLKYRPKEKYKKAVELLYKQIQNQPRIEIGNFWHKLIYPNQVWLDGLYMGQVFYTRYINDFAAEKDYSDIVNQFVNVRKYMFDENKKLYYHGFDYSKKMFWANEKGLSQNFWLRAIGWFVVAMIDVIGYLPKDKVQEIETLSKIFVEAIDGVLQYKDKESNMFYQVVDQQGREGNYLETSGSAMIAYAILKGARLGVLPKDYAKIGKDIFDGICKKYLREVDGKISLGGVCLVAGLGPDDNRRRDGSYEYYISEPIVENDAKGLGPLVMAYTEILQLAK